MYATLGISS